MQKVSTKDRAKHLDAIEILKDYGRKINTASAVGFVDHSQDDDGCATLIVHAVGPGVEEAKSLADFLVQLKRVVAEVEALLPKPEVPSVKKSRKKTDAAEPQTEDVLTDEQEPKPAE
jgi:uncharacterized circularly permuted ATP-grasp superfamily protein